MDLHSIWFVKVLKLYVRPYLYLFINIVSYDLDVILSDVGSIPNLTTPETGIAPSGKTLNQ